MNAVRGPEVTNFNLANALQSHERFMKLYLWFSHIMYEYTNEWLSPE